MSCGTAVGTRCRESARRAEPESGALSGQACLRSKYAGLPLQSFIVRAERAGGARLGRTPLVVIRYDTIRVVYRTSYDTPHRARSGLG